MFGLGCQTWIYIRLEYKYVYFYRVFCAFSASNQESVRAGLLIFKPIKSPQTLPSGSSIESQSMRQTSDRRPVQFPQTGGLQNMFPGLQQAMSQANGFQTGQPSSGYQGSLINGFSSHPSYKFPATGYGVSVEQSQEYGLQDFDFQQQPATSLEFGRQLVAAATKFANPQQQASSYSNEMNNDSGDDQSHSATNLDEHVAQTSPQRHANRMEKPKLMTESDGLPAEFFLPTTTTYGHYDVPSGYTKKRNAPKLNDDGPTATATSLGASIVPLKYDEDLTNPEQQAKLKQTVQRFFNMLQKQRCECINSVPRFTKRTEVI